MKAVLVICEGRSDIAFVRRSLIAIAESKEFGGKVRDLPAPFGTIGSAGSTASKGLIATHISMNFSDKPADDQKISSSARLPPPQFDSAVLNKEESIIYLFVNSEGRDQHEGVINLLKRVDASIKSLGESGDLDVKKYATVFLFDANDRGKVKTIQHFCRNYGEHFGCLSNADHESWAHSKACPVGLYICSGDDGVGTVENYIIPMTKSAWKGRYEGACEFIDQNKHDNDKVSRSIADKLKAIIAIVGQFDFPGDSLLSLIRDKGNGIPDEQLKNSEACKSLVKFLQDIPWGD